MKKKIIIVIGLVLIVGIYFIIYNDKSPIEKSSYEQILEKMENNETFNVYITDDKPVIDRLLKYYNNYGLEYIEFNKSENTKDDYEKLLVSLKMSDKPITMPIFVHVEKGVFSSNIVGIPGEISLKKYLKDNKLIEDKYHKTDIIASDQELEKIKKEVLVLYCVYDEQSYKIREKLLKQNKEYVIVLSGKADAVETEKMIKEEINDITLPMLIKIRDKKIIDYEKEVNAENIVEKLQLLQ